MKHQDALRMDLLLMSRLEIANVPLLPRKDLTVSETLGAAKRLDVAIHKQFPESEAAERIKISRDLAEQLRDPNPYLVANIMRVFYARRPRPGTSSPGSGGMGERDNSRPQKRRDREL